jgi:hypothetical protein
VNIGVLTSIGETDKGAETICGGSCNVAGELSFRVEQTFVAPSLSQKLFTLRPRPAFLRRRQFLGDDLFQFLDGPIRRWLPVQGGPSFSQATPVIRREIAGNPDPAQ